jgi:hypothetical protein
MFSPAEAFRQEDLVDPAPPDRDRLVLVEVSLKSVERPAGEGEPERQGVGHRCGEDLGDLFGRVGGRPPGTGLVGEGRGPLGVEAGDPGVDRGPRDAEVAGDVRGPPSAGGGKDDPGALDHAGFGGA